MTHSHIVIGDNSAEFGKICMDILEQSGFTVTLTEKDGNLLLKQIDETLPEVVIMDAYMKSLDAIGVMKQLNRRDKSKQPACIVTSAFENKFMEDEIMKQGAAYYILKPFDLSALVDRVNDLAGYLESNRVLSDIDAEWEPRYDCYPDDLLNRQREAAIVKVLHAMPITVKLKGYHYIKEAVLRVIADRSLANAVTKELYPSIAKKYSTTSGAVEKAIRTAIEITWDYGNVQALNELLGSSGDTLCDKPSNAKLIAELAEYVSTMLQRKEFGF